MKKSFYVYIGPIILIGITILGVLDTIMLLSGIGLGYLLDKYISKKRKGEFL